MKNLYVLYHGQCVDGHVAGWAAWRRLGHEAQYLQAVYGEAPPEEVVGQSVILVDFSYPRATLGDLHAKGTEIEIQDHHASAIRELSGLPWLTGRMTDERSGAWLSWERFHPDEPVPMIVQYADDRDRWVWALPDSREVSAWLRSWDLNEFDQIDLLADDIEKRRDQCVIEGAAILRAQKQVVDAVVVGATLRDWLTVEIPPDPPMSIVVPVVNTGAHTSEVGEALGKAYPDAPFVAMYHDRAGRRHWSLRTNKANGDVSKIAALLGGGGHAKAAGAETDINWLPPLA